MSEIDKRAVGKRIKMCRERKGLTQAQLSEKIGIETKSYSHIETGVNLFSVGVLCGLSEELDVSTDYILKGCRSTSNPVEEMIGKMKPKDAARAELIIKTFWEALSEGEKNNPRK